VACLQRTLLGGGPPRFDLEAPTERITLDDRSWVDVVRAWLLGADTLFDELVAAVPWRHGRRWMYDRMVDEPRLTRGYSGDEPLPHAVLGDIGTSLSQRYGRRFGGVFLNYYRDGHDSVAFHRDRELRELCEASARGAGTLRRSEPTSGDEEGLVAIVTLGATRPFLFRPRAGGRSIDVRPGSGDLIVMRGRCHCDWEHGVPKVASVGPRISASTRAFA
jgi:alkylated DNA repair dioxygenase AlkB